MKDSPSRPLSFVPPPATQLDLDLARAIDSFAPGTHSLEDIPAVPVIGRDGRIRRRIASGPPKFALVPGLPPKSALSASLPTKVLPPVPRPLAPRAVSMYARADLQSADSLGLVPLVNLSVSWLRNGRPEYQFDPQMFDSVESLIPARLPARPSPGFSSESLSSSYYSSCPTSANPSGLSFALPPLDPPLDPKFKPMHVIVDDDDLFSDIFDTIEQPKEEETNEETQDSKVKEVKEIPAFPYKSKPLIDVVPPILPPKPKNNTNGVKTKPKKPKTYPLLKQPVNNPNPVIKSRPLIDVVPPFSRSYSDILQEYVSDDDSILSNDLFEENMLFTALSISSNDSLFSLDDSVEKTYRSIIGKNGCKNDKNGCKKRSFSAPLLIPPLNNQKNTIRIPQASNNLSLLSSNQSALSVASNCASLHEAKAELKKYARQLPFNYCLDNPKDYTSSRYRALQKSKPRCVSNLERVSEKQELAPRVVSLQPKYEREKANISKFLDKREINKKLPPLPPPKKTNPLKKFMCHA